jgi:hypothetical protein
MTEQEMKLETRLIAIEHVLENLIATVYLMAGFSQQQIEVAHQKASTALSVDTLPGADPVQADMWMSEIEASVSKIQSAAYDFWKEKMERAESMRR